MSRRDAAVEVDRRARTVRDSGKITEIASSGTALELATASEGLAVVGGSPSLAGVASRAAAEVAHAATRRARRGRRITVIRPHAYISSSALLVRSHTQLHGGFMHRRLAAVGLFAGAIALAGCASESANPKSETAAPSVSPSSAAGEGGGPIADARRDVKVTGCSVERAWKRPSAKLVVTNSAAHPFSYLMQVEFLDASGARIEEVQDITDVAAGQKSSMTVQSFEEANGAITCRVTKAQRFQSPA